MVKYCQIRCLNLQIKLTNQKKRITNMDILVFKIIFLIKYLNEIGIKIKGVINGCWSDIHPVDKITLAFVNVGRPFRLIYRPEIFLRDQ